ncbi:MAG: aconitase X catalytic domain-containing protein [bacterium]|nr:aconitase X catalytic domain-containing protein [bacterium]
MQLNAEEREMLQGGRGDAARVALQQQVAVGEFFDAERFVQVSNVHMSGDYEVMGDAGHRYLAALVESGAHVSVTTTRNAQCVEYEFAGRLRQSQELIEHEKGVRRLLGTLGVSLVDTCINYQSVYTPRFNEHVAWGDTGTVAYANSVLGARTNYESGPAAIAAAITGRTPAYGFHLDMHRRASARCVIEADLPDVADWGAVGAVVGERVRDYWSVPLLDVGGNSPSPDALKHLGASLASHGSLAMFHVLGVTPEAPSFEAANRKRVLTDTFTVTKADIDAVYATDTPRGTEVNLVVFTAPQLSLSELDRIAGLFSGRKAHGDSTVLITTNAMNRAAAEATGTLQRLQSAGALVMQGVCWYIMDPAEMRRRFGWSRVVTNSAKLVNIIKAHGYEPILRRTEDCVETAVTGRLA